MHVFKLGAVAAILASPSIAWAGDLHLTITDVQNAKGSVLAALYDSEAAFMHPDRAAGRCKVKAAAGQVVCVFKNVSPGRYAIAAFHDANDNGKLDFNAVGVPTEGYGFSNNAQGAGGPPKFGQAAFSWSGQTPVAIALDN